MQVFGNGKRAFHSFIEFYVIHLKIKRYDLFGVWKCGQTWSFMFDLLHDNYFLHFTTDKQLEVDTVAGTKSKREGIRARSRSMVNGVRKLTRLHSFSGSVPR